MVCHSTKEKFFMFLVCLIVGTMISTQFRSAEHAKQSVNQQRAEDLAEKLGVTRQTIIAIENTKYDPTLELAMKISEFFGVSVNKIFHLEKLAD